MSFIDLGAVLGTLTVLVELINIGTLAAFSMVSIAVLILRRTHLDMPRAFSVARACQSCRCWPFWLACS